MGVHPPLRRSPRMSAAAAAAILAQAASSDAKQPLDLDAALGHSPLLSSTTPAKNNGGKSCAVAAQTEGCVDARGKTRHVYTDVLGTDIESDVRLQSIIQTTHRQNDFARESEHVPSTNFIALTCAWHRPRRRPHHFSDLLRVNHIVARELGYKSIQEHMRTRGWTSSRDPNGKLSLQCRSNLKDVINDDDFLSAHLRAMVDKIYRVVNDEDLKDPLAGKNAVNILKKSSLHEKLRSCAQELHCALAITEHFFLPFVDHRNDDFWHWMLIIYKDCRQRRDFILFCHNFLSLIPENAVKMVQKLLDHHRGHMRDEVNRLASEQSSLHSN